MKKKWGLFILFFSILTIFYPKEVKADKTILQKCVYNANQGLVQQHNNIANSEYYMYIYSDYSAKGVFKSWKGKPVGNEDLVINWDDIKSNSKGSDGKSVICPPFVFISKQQHKGGNYRAWGAYSEEKITKIFNENKGGNGAGWGDDDSGIVKLTTSYNSSGEATTNNITGTETQGTTGTSGLDTESSDMQAKCDYILGNPSIEGSMAWFLQKILNYIKILGPILVIVLSTLDFTKTIMASDAENMKKAQRKLFIRIGCAVGLFFLPLIATTLLNLINGTTGDQTCGLK